MSGSQWNGDVWRGGLYERPDLPPLVAGEFAPRDGEQVVVSYERRRNGANSFIERPTDDRTFVGKPVTVGLVRRMANEGVTHLAVEGRRKFDENTVSRHTFVMADLLDTDPALLGRG